MNVRWGFIYRVKKIESGEHHASKLLEETQQLRLRRSCLLLDVSGVDLASNRPTLWMTLEGLLDQDLEKVMSGRLGVIAVSKVDVGDTNWFL